MLKDINKSKEWSEIISQELGFKLLKDVYSEKQCAYRVCREKYNRTVYIMEGYNIMVQYDRWTYFQIGSFTEHTIEELLYKLNEISEDYNERS